MKNKKAFLRIVEAIVAMLIIMGVVLVIASKQTQRTDISEEIYEKQRFILDVIANNEDMRNDIINGNKDSVNAYISKNIPATWGFETNICGVEELCNEGTPNDRDLYVSETIISATLTSFPNHESKKLRFFVWRK